MAAPLLQSPRCRATSEATRLDPTIPGPRPSAARLDATSPESPRTRTTCPALHVATAETQLFGLSLNLRREFLGRFAPWMTVLVDQDPVLKFRLAALTVFLDVMNFGLSPQHL